MVKRAINFERPSVNTNLGGLFNLQKKAVQVIRFCPQRLHLLRGAHLETGFCSSSFQFVQLLLKVRDLQKPHTRRLLSVNGTAVTSLLLGSLTAQILGHARAQSQNETAMFTSSPIPTITGSDSFH